MDIGALLSDSFTYAQEALVGKWTRWAIFILFALPFSLIQFLIDPKTIMTGTELNWGAIPWGQIAFLAGLGFILSFFLSGYTVRIYRGTTPAPDFTGWTDLFVDGIRARSGLVPLDPAPHTRAGSGNRPCTHHVPFHPGTIRFTGLDTPGLLYCAAPFRGGYSLHHRPALWNPRCSPVCPDGSIREGIRFSAILTTIRTIGWISYIILLIGYIIAMVIYAVITGILSFIPYIGWVLLLVVNPIFTIFSARYFCAVYNQGEPKTVPPVPSAGETLDIPPLT